MFSTIVDIFYSLRLCILVLGCQKQAWHRLGSYSNSEVSPEHRLHPLRNLLLVVCEIVETPLTILNQVSGRNMSTTYSVLISFQLYLTFIITPLKIIHVCTAYLVSICPKSGNCEGKETHGNKYIWNDDSSAHWFFWCFSKIWRKCPL
jgi:hypothetical protein